MADKITSIIAREDDGNIQITFTIPFQIVKAAEDETVKEFAKDTEIPGFRKGMAPLGKVAEKISQSQLIERSLSHILSKALSEAISENKLKIAVYPKFELISAKENESWQIRGITCELPEVILGDYKKAVEGASRASNLWTPDKGAPTEKKEPTNEEKEQVVVKTLLETVKIKIPRILIEDEADSRLSNLLSRLEKLGLALEGYLSSIGKKPEDLRADYARQAQDAISLDLILSKIAEAEGIKIDPKEVDSALGMSQSAAQVKEEAPEDIESRKRLLESILKRRAALDFLIKLS
ncbi:MAG: trigger factor [Candidatus Microgenomates bacterium]|jgi:FKBP-type peptidyl-prolyl cis-trans isomerase (trigger factor)